MSKTSRLLLVLYIRYKIIHKRKSLCSHVVGRSDSCLEDGPRQLSGSDMLGLGTLGRLSNSDCRVPTLQLEAALCQTFDKNESDQEHRQ